MASYELQPVLLKTGTRDQEGRLIFIDGELAAVIVMLADESHLESCGFWSMEADFRVIASYPPLFESPDHAASWLIHRDDLRQAG